MYVCVLDGRVPLLTPARLFFFFFLHEIDLTLFPNKYENSRWLVGRPLRPTNRAFVPCGFHQPYVRNVWFGSAATKCYNQSMRPLFQSVIFLWEVGTSLAIPLTTLTSLNLTGKRGILFNKKKKPVSNFGTIM